MIRFDESKKLDIITLGRANLDFNPVPEEMGKKLSECVTFKKYLGGSPANIAVGMARLGLKPAFISRVADDRFGEFVTEYMIREGVDISHVHKCAPGICQGLAFTEVYEGKSSLVMHRNGAADLDLRVEDIDEDYISQTKIVLISGTALSASPSREAALKAIELAKRHGCVLVFDIDYRAYTWTSTDEIAVYCGWAAQNADIIMGSREELDFAERLIKPGCTDEESARLWFSHRAKLVVIKHGKDGSVGYSRDGAKYTVRTYPAKVMKSYGGGDGYGSAFFYGLLSGAGLRQAFTYATASATILVSCHGCSENMPDAETLKAFVEKNEAQSGPVVTCEDFAL